MLHFVVVIHALPVAIKARHNFQLLHLHPDRQTTSHKFTELKGHSQTIRCQIQQQQKIFLKKKPTQRHILLEFRTKLFYKLNTKFRLASEKRYQFILE